MCCHWIDEFCRSCSSPTPSIYIDSRTDLMPDMSAIESVLPQCEFFFEFRVPFVSCSSYTGVCSALPAGVFWNLHLEFYAHFSHHRTLVSASHVYFCSTFPSNTSFSFGICFAIHCCVVLNVFSLVHPFAAFSFCLIAKHQTTRRHKKRWRVETGLNLVFSFPEPASFKEGTWLPKVLFVESKSFAMCVESLYLQVSTAVNKMREGRDRLKLLLTWDCHNILWAFWLDGKKVPWNLNLTWNLTVRLAEPFLFMCVQYL